MSSAALVKVFSRAGSWEFSGTFVVGTTGARELSPRASSVPSLWWGAPAIAVRASVRCMGP